MRTAVATLSAPSIALLFVLALFLNSYAVAQAPSQLMFANFLDS